MKPVSFGIIGCGVIGNVHAKRMLEMPHVKLVAVADVIEQRAQKAGKDYNVSAVYPSGDALLDDPNVEAVTLGLPAQHRTALALKAVANGKHVLIEKPIAMNAGEVERLIKARGDRVVGCFTSRHRWQPSAKAATECICKGTLGRIRMVHCRAMMKTGPKPANSPPTWRLRRSENGGGILMNWGCYDLDYLLGVTGWSLVPKTVLAQCWTAPPAYAGYLPPNSDGETHFAAMIRCQGGEMISFERAEYVPGRPSNVWQIIGENGTLQLQMIPDDDQVSRVILDRADTDKGVIPETLYAGREDFVIPHAGPIDDFARAIREGRQPDTTLEKALVVQKITDAIYESARTGSAVEIR